jgi:phage terminase small subunit
MLPNSRHEAFAHGLARGKSVDVAYVEAGYSQNRGNGSRLNRNVGVMARVIELKALVERMREGTINTDVLTRAWIIEQLIDTVTRCKSHEKIDSAGANKALHLLGLQLGMFVERKETGKPGEFGGLSIASKRERIMDIARELGLDRIGAHERLSLARQSTLKATHDWGHASAPTPPQEPSRLLTGVLPPAAT